MFLKLFFFVIYVNAATSRMVARYDELDEADQLLFRAAYDSPPYTADEYNQYQTDEDMSLNKLDLLKDGMLAMKAKIKQMKALNKALVANLLSTKLQVKEMLANHMLVLNKHHHVIIDKQPDYDYQSPTSKPAYLQYNPPAPQYSTPAPQYGPPAPLYGPSAPQYGPPAAQYGPTAPQYSPPAPQYGPPAPQYGPFAPQYRPQQPQYAAPEYVHDPYYGH